LPRAPELPYPASSATAASGSADDVIDLPDRLVLELRAHRFRDLAAAVEVLKAVADAECITVKVRVAPDPRPELARRCNAAPEGLGLVW